MKKLLLTLAILISSLVNSLAQEQKGVTLSGSIQSDMLIPQSDETIKAVKTEDFQTNTYADLQLQSKYADAGIRLEYLEHPLPGFENDFTCIFHTLGKKPLIDEWHTPAKAVFSFYDKSLQP